MTATYLGIYSRTAPEDCALGVFYLIHGNDQLRPGWYVRAWRENVGPYDSRGGAEESYWQITRQGQGVEIAQPHAPIKIEITIWVLGAISAVLLSMIRWEAVSDAIRAIFQ